MIKNEMFQSGIFWLLITSIACYAGLFRMTGYNVFIYGMWAGVALANALIRFKRAYIQEKGNTK